MTRDARSAKTLISEFESVLGHVDVERLDLDGLKVYRTYRIKSKTHKGLDDVINAVADNRIVQSKAITGGVEVTFTHTPLADGSGRFGVLDAKDLLTKKRAKKAAAKPPPKDAD